MSLVYRIQSKQDRTRGAYWDLGLLAHKRNKYPQPLPENDVGIDRELQKDEHCGCKTASDLLHWFGGAIPDLLRGGLEIVALYNVEVTAIGEYQVLFKWRD